MKWLATTETVNLKLLVPSGLTVAGLVGATVGYVVASKTLEKKFRELTDQEIAEARVFYQNLYHRAPLVVDPVEEEEDSEDLEEDEKAEDNPAGTWDELSSVQQDRIMTNAVQALGTYVPPTEEVEVTEKTREVTVRNTFTEYQAPGDEVMAALMADRDPSEPYIITKSEYYENEPDHEQKAFTYYEADQVLVDDQEEYNPIEDHDRVVGEDNLLRFGYGSGDEHVLYIRNETVDPPFDLCITRSTGKYTDEVMGFADDEPHLKHSQRRFRLHEDD